MSKNGTVRRPNTFWLRHLHWLLDPYTKLGQTQAVWTRLVVSLQIRYESGEPPHLLTPTFSEAGSPRRRHSEVGLGLPPSEWSLARAKRKASARHIRKVQGPGSHYGDRNFQT